MKPEIHRARYAVATYNEHFAHQPPTTTETDLATGRHPFAAEWDAYYAEQGQLAQAATEAIKLAYGISTRREWAAFLRWVRETVPNYHRRLAVGLEP